MSDRLYSEEKYTMAVLLLATGLGDPKDRLMEAFYQIHGVPISAFPDELQSDHNWILESLTKKPAKQSAYIDGKWTNDFEGRIGATLAYMRYTRAEEIAIRICGLASRLSHLNRLDEIAWGCAEKILADRGHRGDCEAVRLCGLSASAYKLAVSCLAGQTDGPRGLIGATTENVSWIKREQMESSYPIFACSY